MQESVEQIDPTELSSSEVAKRAKKGVAVLTARTFLIQGISFFSNALLTVFLLPSEYGVFFLVSAVISFLAYFSDIGFAASLIQKKEVNDEDLKTVFTAQQILVVGLLIILLLISGSVASFYKLESPSVFLLYAVGLSLFFSSLKTIPSVLLERRLEFNKLVIPQIIETIVFNATAVYLAWRGFGVTSFTMAVLLRGISGLLAMYIISPWLPRISFSINSLKSILKFGIPYQMNAFLAMIKDDGMTLFLGGILGAGGIGLLGWAQKWAYAPLRFFMDQVIKVTFPAFSRLQDQKAELSNAASKSILFICILVFPSLILLVLSAPTLVEIIPKYSKWENGLFALGVLSLTSALAAVTTPITNILNAVGKISITFKLMVMWTILTWLFVPLLALSYGLNGAALGFVIVGLSSFIALYAAKKYVDLNYFKIAGRPMLASVLMALLVYGVGGMLSASWLKVVLMTGTGIFSYTLFALILLPDTRNIISGYLRKK